MSKAWLAYQKRVSGGYVIKIGKAADFQETLETLKLRIPSSARRYNSDKKDWYVAEAYEDVLADVFYDFQRDTGKTPWVASPVRSTSETHTYHSRVTAPAKRSLDSGGCAAIGIVAVIVLMAVYSGMFHGKGSTTATTTTVRSTPTTRPAALAPVATARSTNTATVASVSPLAPTSPPTVAPTQTPRPTATTAIVVSATTVNNARVRGGPCLNHAIVRTLPQGTSLAIVGYSRDASHVWYVLRDGGWVREDLVRNAPTVPEVNGPACPTPPTPAPATSTPIPAPAPPAAQGCPGGCTSFPAFCEPPIKGNVSFNGGERIYHMPHQQYYESTVIDPRYGERWFCSEAEAQAAGWRKAYR